MKHHLTETHRHNIVLSSQSISLIKTFLYTCSYLPPAFNLSHQPEPPFCLPEHSKSKPVQSFGTRIPHQWTLMYVYVSWTV